MIVGTGVDIVDIHRIQKVVEGRKEAFIRRVYTDLEQEKINQFLQGNAKARAFEFMAGRFAVKEAVAKALGCGIGKIGWREIEVRNKDTGAPEVFLTGNALEFSQNKKIKYWHVSISHTSETAIAYVIAEE